MKERFTVKEAAEYLGIAASTVYAYAEKKKIAHYRIGTKCTFNKEHLDAFLDKCLVHCED